MKSIEKLIENLSYEDRQKPVETLSPKPEIWCWEIHSIKNFYFEGEYEKVLLKISKTNQYRNVKRWYKRYGATIYHCYLCDCSFREQYKNKHKHEKILSDKEWYEKIERDDLDLFKIQID